jgi:hypothetical protein
MLMAIFTSITFNSTIQLCHLGMVAYRLGVAVRNEEREKMIFEKLQSLYLMYFLILKRICYQNFFISACLPFQNWNLYRSNSHGKACLEFYAIRYKT